MPSITAPSHMVLHCSFFKNGTHLGKRVAMHIASTQGAHTCAVRLHLNSLFEQVKWPPSHHYFCRNDGNQCPKVSSFSSSHIRLGQGRFRTPQILRSQLSTHGVASLSHCSRSMTMKFNCWEHGAATLINYHR